MHVITGYLAALASFSVLVGCSASGAGTDSTPVREPTVTARFTPSPELANGDIPSRPECQMAPVAPNKAPVVCEFGDPDAQDVVMLVGDSKMVQWRPAFERPGRRIIQVTKSACAFTDVMTSFQGKAWTDCRRWGRQVLDLILHEHPDLVVTSQRRPAAMTGDDPADVAPGAMVTGLVSYWSQIVGSGIRLAVLLDNPGPKDYDVPVCLVKHHLEAAACAFDTAEGLAGSAAAVQQAAAAQVPGIVLLDLNKTICPRAKCSPVTDDGVLIFRQGTHVTATYAATLAPRIAELLAQD